MSVMSLAGMRLVQCGRLNCVTNILTCFGTRMLCGVALGVGVGVGGASVCVSEVGGAAARGWERGWERDCECVLFVTVCHCNKYAFIVVRCQCLSRV